MRVCRRKEFSSGNRERQYLLLYQEYSGLFRADYYMPMPLNTIAIINKVMSE